MKIGSLFSGYGGLDMGVQVALGGTVAWHAEIDKNAARILANHWPDVPNLGDITAVDWTQVQPVDVLCGGFPCQDVSTAGKRAGIAPGTRSGLWSHFAYAIDQLHPQLVVIENVRGLLSATAHSDMEPCPWCVGDDGGGPVLRALGAVLGDLADLGYDARWASVRASDVGACHRRERIFVIAYPADAVSIGHDGCGDGCCAGCARCGWCDAARPSDDAANTDGRRRDESINQLGNLRTKNQKGAATLPDGHSADKTIAAADLAGGQTRRDTRCDCAGFWVEPVGLAAPTADADCERHGRRHVGRMDSHHAGQTRQRQRARQIAGDRGTTDWGPYADAIHRWERVLGRPAPPPTEPGVNGGPRLSPVFVEWMMGLPTGHVTHPDIGISRNAQLKALGNGVVPQQAAHAITQLLTN